MRSPLPIPGRNTLLERIWQSITSFNRTPVQGQQRPLAGYLTSTDDTALGRSYDLEISEIPIRDPQKARQLIEMYEYCTEVATAISEITDSVWSSDDGDDQGFGISPTLNDNETKVNPNVERILRRVIDEVIGGITLEPAAERILIYGDAFASLGINSRKMQVERVLFVPTWEMFRIEDNQAQLLGFEQRRYLSDSDAIRFHPIACVHWRYRRKTLYGRSLFHESVDDWKKLKAATDDLANASRAIGLNANLHFMPSCASEEYRADYKKNYEAKKALGAVTDFYLMNDADVRKLSQINPDLKALTDAVLVWRSRIVMKSRVPPYLMGLPNTGAREIAGQPALAYARFLNRVRASLSEGIKHILNVELALNDIPKRDWQYRLIWPRIATNPYGVNIQTDDESNNPEIEDLN